VRVGDFGVEVLPSGSGSMRETDTGHVLARPGQVYKMRLRNFGPLRAVVQVELDGRPVTAGGLVLSPWRWTDLERPIDDGEEGCFTVVAEGDERVFGPDGGRDNQSLGLIRASFRRELPEERRGLLIEAPDFSYPTPPDERTRWPRQVTSARPTISALRTAETPLSPMRRTGPSIVDAERNVERAAGTGLTGHSDQRFTPVHVGRLEPEATVLQLRLVIASESAINEDAPRPLSGARVPERPAARP
jgi:hypothetical protein